MRIAGCVAAVAVIGGCSRPTGPDVLRLPAAEYQRMFDVAVETARDAGLPAAFRDRRGGFIETDARVAGSLIEPWRTDNASLDQVIENTIGYQRRKARFEFVPAMSDSTSAPEGPAGETSDIDLTDFEGDLELRVWVYIERANAPGYRRAAWSRRTATRADFGRADQEFSTLASTTVWTPVARDRDYERRLLGKIEDALQP